MIGQIQDIQLVIMFALPLKIMSIFDAKPFYLNQNNFFPQKPQSEAPGMLSYVKFRFE